MIAEDNRRRGLGRGLSALLGDAPEDAAPAASGSGVRILPVEALQPGKFQPRRRFEEEAIRDLVESIREKGILQPLLVRALDNDRYEIIAGERRWRAAQMAQVHQVPVLVKEFDDKEALEVALVENLQREDLTPLEEAEGYRRLQEEFNHTQEDLARVVGKSRSHVANMMRLLGLPAPVRTMLEQGTLTAGHARALLTAKDPQRLAEEVVKKGLNVRQTEKLAAKVERAPAARAARDHAQDADTLALERDLSNLLGLKVSVRFHGKGGELTIHYGNLDQLDEILHRLSHGREAEVPQPREWREEDFDAEEFETEPTGQAD